MQERSPHLRRRQRAVRRGVAQRQRKWKGLEMLAWRIMALERKKMPIPLDLISLFGQESGARSHKKGGGKSKGSPGVSGVFKGTTRGRARSCPRHDIPVYLLETCSMSHLFVFKGWTYVCCTTQLSDCDISLNSETMKSDQVQSRLEVLLPGSQPVDIFTRRQILGRVSLANLRMAGDV